MKTAVAETTENTTIAEQGATVAPEKASSKKSATQKKGAPKAKKTASKPATKKDAKPAATKKASKKAAVKPVNLDHLSPNEREDLSPEASALVVRLLSRENIPVGNLLEAPRCPGVLAPPVPPRAPGDCPEDVHTVAAFSTPWSTLPDRERTVRVIVLRVGPAGRSFVSFDYIFVRRDLNWNLVERRFRVIIE